MGNIHLYPPVKGFTYRWFIFSECHAPYTGAVLNDEKPASESEAMERMEQLARKHPGRSFGYGFWTVEGAQPNTAVAECRHLNGELQVHSWINAEAA